MEALPRRTGVLIVGAGTVGKYLAGLLGRYKVPHLVVERVNAQLGVTKEHPRAHVLHTRTMELMREFGLEAKLRSAAPPPSEWSHFRYLPSVFGREEHGVVDHLHPTISSMRFVHDAGHYINTQKFYKGKTFERLRAASPTELTHVSQPIVDSLLGKVMHDQGTQVVFGMGYKGHESIMNESGTSVGRLRVALGSKICEVEPTGGNHHVDCEFLVGADGASSLVRQAMGAKLDGEKGLTHFMSIHYTTPPGLAEELRRRGRWAMLYFVVGSKQMACLVAHNVERGEWVAQVPFFPPHQAPQDFTPDVCQQILRDCYVADPDDAPVGVSLDFNIHSVRAWTMSGLVASHFSDHSLRVHLVGDAAHQFPPSGGFGLNAGLHDAHNLAWRLAAALKDSNSSGARTTTAPLAGYSAERRPAALRLRDCSVDNFRRGLLLPEAFGLSHGALVGLGTTIEGAKLPRAVGKVAVEAALSVGRQALSVASSPGVQRLLNVKQRVERAVSRDASLPMLFPRQDLGHVYEAVKGASVAYHRPPTGKVAPNVWKEEGVEQYRPHLAAGHRLPHVWLAPVAFVDNCDGEDENLGRNDNDISNACRISTLDLVGRAVSPRPNTGVGIFEDRNHAGDLEVDHIHHHPHLVVISTFPPGTVDTHVHHAHQRSHASCLGVQIADIAPATPVTEEAHETCTREESGGIRWSGEGRQEKFGSTRGGRVVYIDPEGKWHRLIGEWRMSQSKQSDRHTSGALVVVRPDGYVAGITIAGIQGKGAYGQFGDDNVCKTLVTELDAIFSCAIVGLRGLRDGERRSSQS